MEVKELTIIDIAACILFSIPAWIILVRIWVISDAPIFDSTLIILVLIFTFGVGTYYFCKILSFIINWWLVVNATEMTTEAIVTKSFLKTQMTVDELSNTYTSFEKNYDGFEIERSRSFIEKIAMNTKRDIATNINVAEFQVFNKKYYIKTKLTDKELLQNNMFRQGQNYRLYQNKGKFFIEKNRIIYILVKGQLNECDYNKWLTCNRV